MLIYDRHPSSLELTPQIAHTAEKKSELIVTGILALTALLETVYVKPLIQ